MSIRWCRSCGTVRSCGAHGFCSRNGRPKISECHGTAETVENLTMLITGHLQNMTIRVMSRSLHQVEDKFDRLVDAILKLSEASCFSQPSAMAVKSVAPYVCPPPAEHITLAEHSATSFPRPAEHNNNRPANGDPHSPVSTTYYPLADLNQSVPLHNLQTVP